MKSIILKNLKIQNFKGIKSLDFFPGMVTEVHGANGTGKTSIFDAFTWLLYGKNSTDQKDFNIKTLDENGQPIHQLDHTVEGTLEIDGRTVCLRRVYREKWTTRRGEQTPHMSGHESKFFIDEVPKSSTEFAQEVNELISETISKVLTNPAYFNEKLKWGDRREVLTDMAGTIDEPGLAERAGLEEVFAMFNEGRSVDDQKRVINSQRKKLKEEAEHIPARLDELHTTKPEAKDWDAIEKEIEEKTQEVKKLETHIEDENELANSKNEERNKASRELMDLESKLDGLQSELIQEANRGRNSIASKIKTLRQESADHTGNADRLSQKIELKTSEIETKERRLEQLRKEWTTINAETFNADGSETVCPCCDRQYDDAENRLEELKTGFNTGKVSRLENNQKAGKIVAGEVEALKLQQKEMEVERSESMENSSKLLSEIEELTEKQNSPVQMPEPTEEMKALQQQIDSFELPKMFVAADMVELKNMKQGYETEIQNLRKLLYDREQIEKIDKRREELEAQQRQLAQTLSNLEKIEFQIDEFNRLKIEEVENRVNDRFALVSFKMFEQQVNGAQAPACECMVDGVPYNDLNTANKINAGLDVLNALQHHYEITAPVFIDNRESVTEVLPVSCQLISLIVDPTAKELEILNV